MKKILSALCAGALAFSSVITAFAQSADYDFSIYDDTKSFTDEQKQAQQDFDDILTSVFIDDVTSDTMSLHFTLLHPEKYGIEKSEPTWGDLTDSSDDAQINELKDLQDSIEKFNYDDLTSEQQLIYDILEMDIENALAVPDTNYFRSVFSPLSGLQSQFPVVFSEYQFIEKQDIDDYLTLLETCGDYIDYACKHEKERADNGFALSQNGLDDVITQCSDFISAEPNSLSPVFEQKLEEFGGLSDDEKQEYTERFDAALSSALIPGYQRIIDTLTDIKALNIESKGMSQYENGAEFYNYLLKGTLGSASSTEELYNRFVDHLDSYMTQMQEIISNNPKVYTEMTSFEYPTDDPKEMMSILSEAIKDDFPKAVTTDYTLSYVPESLESTMAPAYYVVPAIDDSNNNRIFINRNEDYANMDLFPTIAHEGMPGHMYQTNYFASLDPQCIRNSLSFTGYTEGWAQYIQSIYAFEYAGMSEDLKKVMQYNELASYMIYAVADLGINYVGWSFDDAKEFLSPYFGSDEAVEDTYYTLIDDPTAYINYVGGCMEIMDLREEAEKQLGDDFNVKEFHRFILEIGPCQFEIIGDRMNDWIDRVKSGGTTEQDSSSESSSEKSSESSETSSQTDESTLPEKSETKPVSSASDNEGGDSLSSTQITILIGSSAGAGVIAFAVIMIIQRKKKR